MLCPVNLNCKMAQVGQGVVSCSLNLISWFSCGAFRVARGIMCSLKSSIL